MYFHIYIFIKKHNYLWLGTYWRFMMLVPMHALLSNYLYLGTGYLLVAVPRDLDMRRFCYNRSRKPALSQ